MTLEQKLKFLVSFILEKQELDKYDAQTLVYIDFLKICVQENLMYLTDVDEIIRYSKFLRHRCIETQEDFYYRYDEYNPLSEEIIALLSDNLKIGCYIIARSQLVQQHNIRWWHYYHLHRHLEYFQ